MLLVQGGLVCSWVKIEGMFLWTPMGTNDIKWWGSWGWIIHIIQVYYRRVISLYLGRSDNQNLDNINNTTQCAIMEAEWG